MPVSYRVDRPTSQDADGLIRRTVTVNDDTIVNHSEYSKQFEGDPAELTSRAKITAWEKQCARKVHSIMASRQASDDERAVEQAKWADPVEDSRDNTIQEEARR